MTVRDGRRQGAGHTQVPVQEQADPSRLDRDRSLPVDVQLGDVSPYQEHGHALQVGLAHESQLPCFGIINGQVQDLSAAPKIGFVAGTIVIDNRDDNDSCLLRRIEAQREDTSKVLVFLTNHHRLGTSTIAVIDKKR
jgi:hypothetical protein